MAKERIPQSRSVRWRKARGQVLPAVFFLTALGASGWLWQFHASSVHGVGKVESPRVDLTSPRAGLVVELPSESRGQWLVYDHVRTGDVIARIQDHDLEVAKRLLRQDVEQLIAQFDQARPSDAPNETAWSAARSRLMTLLQQIIASDRMDAQVLLESVVAQLQTTAEDTATDDESLGLLQSQRAALARRFADILRRSEMLEIQSPLTGTLVAVHCWPGQAVPAGGLIATIAADHAQQVVGYIPEHSPIMPEPGAKVALRTREFGAAAIESEVEEVGMQVERIPDRQRAGSSMPEWGIPIRITLPPDSRLRPGSLVDLTFLGSSQL